MTFLYGCIKFIKRKILLNKIQNKASKCSKNEVFEEAFGIQIKFDYGCSGKPNLVDVVWLLQNPLKQN